MRERVGGNGAEDRRGSKEVEVELANDATRELYRAVSLEDMVAGVVSIGIVLAGMQEASPVETLLWREKREQLALCKGIKAIAQTMLESQCQPQS